jgi:hypothetical protein
MKRMRKFHSTSHLVKRQLHICDYWRKKVVNASLILIDAMQFAFLTSFTFNRPTLEYLSDLTQRVAPS